MDSLNNPGQEEENTTFFIRQQENLNLKSYLVHKIDLSCGVKIPFL